MILAETVGEMMKRRLAGFTLVELMVVVAIIGVLAAVAIPTFMKNARKARSSEAIVQIRKIYASSRTYIFEPYSARGVTGVLAAQFPESEARTPAGRCCLTEGQKCIDDTRTWWTTPTWQALQFSLDDAHYYQYEYESTGSAHPGAGSIFTARATGDLNCDGELSTFEMVGEWSSSDRDVRGSAGIYIKNPIE
jgi:type IV pilus assembly protein PilA